MKITKTSAEAKSETIKRDRLYQQVSVCPHCGERKTTWDYILEGNSSSASKGILIGEVVHEGLFRVYRALSAECLTCGTEWESDPF